MRFTCRVLETLRLPCVASHVKTAAPTLRAAWSGKSVAAMRAERARSVSMKWILPLRFGIFDDMMILLISKIEPLPLVPLVPYIQEGKQFIVEATCVEQRIAIA